MPTYAHAPYAQSFLEREEQESAVEARREKDAKKSLAAASAHTGSGAASASLKQKGAKRNAKAKTKGREKRIEVEARAVVQQAARQVLASRQAGTLAYRQIYGQADRCGCLPFSTSIFD
jgi:hypothetical protein